MTQEKKTDKSFDEKLQDKISSAVFDIGMCESIKYNEPLVKTYCALACMFAHIIATKDEVAMQEFRASLGLEPAEVAKGAANE